MTPSEFMRHPAADHSAGARRLVNAEPPRLTDDSLDTARGIVWGVLMSLPLWALIALAWWVL